MTSVPENIPRLTLYNFEEPQYGECDYVLTSPRSLEACSRLKVKPVDLLYKPLADFQEELQDYDLHPSTVYFFYNEQENERQAKLRSCWEERSQIIKEEVEEVTNSGRRKEFSRHDPRINQDYSAAKDPVSKYMIDDILGCGSIETLSQAQKIRSACSLSENRLTKDFINESAKQLHEESMKLRHELMSRKENRFRRKKNAAGSETPVDVPLSPKAISEPISITREKSPTTSEKSDWSKSRGNRKPKLTPKDQKILNLMRAKREAEKAFCHRREKLHLAWDDEQKREEAAKMAMENIRRRRLAAENLLRKQEQEHWEHERKKLTELETIEKELAVEYCSEHRAKLVAEIQERKEREWTLRREKDIQKKHSQEINMKDRDKEEEGMRRRIEEKQKEELTRASMRKMKQIRQIARKLRKANAERFEKCKTQKESLNIQSREGFENLMATLERQHAQAKTNHEKLLKQKEVEHKAKRKELEMRIEENRKLQKKIEEEMLNRQQHYNDESEREKKHLLAAAAKFADLKAKKARQDRLSRERCQTANMRKVNLCLELWKKKTEQNLQGKIRKCEEMQAAKDYQMSQVRASAIESQKMRDKLRDYYDCNNFDKKLLEAQLHVKMGSGVQTASKNLSSLLLG